MQVTKFDIEFEQGKRKKKASFTAFMAGHSRYMMYRVFVPDNAYGEVYIFYLTDKAKRRFFWYPLHDSRDRIAFAIARALKECKEPDDAARKTPGIISDGKPGNDKRSAKKP